MTRIAINALGRTGRVMLREHLDARYQDIDVVAINDLTGIDNLAYLLRYDAVHGRLQHPLEVTGDQMVLPGRNIRVLSQVDPAQLPWRELQNNLRSSARRLSP